jgi:hypothetical protein
MEELKIHSCKSRWKLHRNGRAKIHSSISSWKLHGNRRAKIHSCIAGIYTGMEELISIPV